MKLKRERSCRRQPGLEEPDCGAQTCLYPSYHSTKATVHCRQENKEVEATLCPNRSAQQDARWTDRMPCEEENTDLM
ncbi:hypothetical protein AOLI_G00159800 [Acnodon oligacanthus]